MPNYRMIEKIAARQAVNISKAPVTEEGWYDITDLWDLTDGMDFCDLDKELWIWSIGKDTKTDRIYASTGMDFYDAKGYDCLWLR